MKDDVRFNMTKRTRVKRMFTESMHWIPPYIRIRRNDSPAQNPVQLQAETNPLCRSRPTLFDSSTCFAIHFEIKTLTA